MGFAGLWERWRIPRNMVLPRSLQDSAPGDEIETCTILTTEANELMKPIHHRMPVILPPEAFSPWLDGEEVALDPYPTGAMTARAVSLWVNNAAHEDPRCIEPADSAWKARASSEARG